MVLVDTNVVAYLLIEGKQTARRSGCAGAIPIGQRGFSTVEFTNVSASSIANKRMTLSLAEELLARAARYSTGNWDASLTRQCSQPRALRRERLRCALSWPSRSTRSRLVTEDAKLRTRRPHSLIRGRSASDSLGPGLVMGYNEDREFLR